MNLSYNVNKVQLHKYPFYDLYKLMLQKERRLVTALTDNAILSYYV